MKHDPRGFYPQRSLMSSNPKAHRINVIYLLGLTVIFSIGVWLRVALPFLPFFNNDSWGYLQPAITSLANGASESSHRGFFYPAILWSILKLWPSFSAIVVVQHALGLLAGILAVTVWERMRVFLPFDEEWLCYMHRLFGLVILAVFLFSNAIISYEHSIIPEGIFPFIIILCIFVAIEFSHRIFILRNLKGTNVLACLLVTLACAAYYLKPAWGLGVFTAIVPLFISWLVVPSFRRVVSSLLGFLLVFALLTLPEHLTNRAVEINTSFLPTTLLCSNGETFYRVLKKDSALLSSTNTRKKIADMLLPQFYYAFQHSRFIPFGYSFLNPDSLLYDGAMTTLKAFLQNSGKEELSRICYEYYWRCWKEYPFFMLWKIVLQLSYFYCPWKSVNYSQAQDFQISRHFQNSLQVLHDRPTYTWPPYQVYRNQVLAHLTEQPQPRFSLLPPLVTLATLLNPLYTPTVLLATVAAILVIFSRLLIFRDLFPAAVACLYLFSYNFAMTLTIAIVHMTAVDRYHFVQTIFSILSQCFALMFLACFLRRLLLYKQLK